MSTQLGKRTNTPYIELTFMFSALPALARCSGADFVCLCGCGGGNFVVLPNATLTLLAPCGESTPCAAAAPAWLGDAGVVVVATAADDVAASVLAGLPDSDDFFVSGFVSLDTCFGLSSAGLCSRWYNCSLRCRRMSALRFMMF